MAPVISDIGLAQPSAGQVAAQITSAFANGATGEFLYNLVSNEPALLGRGGWYAPDARDAWAALTAAHALEDSFLPVLFSSATVAFGKQGALEWRSWTLGLHRPRSHRVELGLRRARLHDMRAAREHDRRRARIRGGGRRDDRAELRTVRAGKPTTTIRECPSAPSSSPRLRRDPQQRQFP